MAAYMIAQITVTNPEKYEDYKKAVSQVAVRFGGRYLIRGGQIEVLEGSHDGRRLVLFEFPGMEDIRAFWTSPEYLEAKGFREGAAVLDVWAVPGL